jgi:hypothetical protein
MTEDRRQQPYDRKPPVQYETDEGWAVVWVMGILVGLALGALIGVMF